MNSDEFRLCKTEGPVPGEKSYKARPSFDFNYVMPIFANPYNRGNIGTNQPRHARCQTGEFVASTS